MASHCKELPKVASTLLTIWSGVTILIDVFALGFRRSYPVYGGGIWVGLCTTAYCGLLSASIGRSKRARSFALLAASAGLLIVVVVGLAVASIELYAADAKLKVQRSRQLRDAVCLSCGELIIAKCAFQMVANVAVLALVAGIIHAFHSARRSSDQLATASRPKLEAAENFLSGGRGDSDCPKSFSVAVPMSQLPPMEPLLHGREQLLTSEVSTLEQKQTQPSSLGQRPHQQTQPSSSGQRPHQQQTQHSPSGQRPHTQHSQQQQQQRINRSKYRQRSSSGRRIPPR